MAASLRFDGLAGPQQIVAGARVLSNFNNTGVLGWHWELQDRPAGSAAVISSPFTAVSGFTADTPGSYKVRLRTYSDVGRTVLDAIDIQIAYIKYSGTFDWRKPAAGETREVDPTRGWATAHDEFEDDVHTFIAGGMQAVFDVARTIVTTVAKGPLALSSVQDVSLLTLIENTAAAVQPILAISSTAVARTGACLSIINAGAVAIDITTTGGFTVGLKMQEVFHNPLYLRPSELIFSKDSDATVRLDDAAPANHGNDLILAAQNAVGAAKDGGAVSIQGGNPGAGGVEGTVNIATVTGSQINTGHSSATLLKHSGLIEIDQSGNALVIDATTIFFDGSSNASIGVDNSSVAGKHLSVKAGDGLATADGGNLLLRSGDAFGGSQQGGDVVVTAGAGPNGDGWIYLLTSGPMGQIRIQDDAPANVTVGDIGDTSGTAIFYASVTVANGLSIDRITSTVAFAADISPTAISGVTTNWNPSGIGGAVVVRIDLSAEAEITSISGGVDGRILILSNIDPSFSVYLRHDDGATGTAANRFLLPNGAQMVINPGAAAAIIYDSTSQRWRCYGSTTNLVTPPRSVSGTTDTPTRADHGTTISHTNAGAITSTIGTMPAGTRIEFYQDGAGQITLSASGITLRIPTPFVAKTRAQYSVIGVYFISTTVAVVYGDLA